MGLKDGVFDAEGESVNFVKAEVKKWSLLSSYLWDGTDANTVDERTLQNLTFLQETKNGGKKVKKEVDEEGENKSLEEKQFLMVSKAQAPQHG